MRERYHKNKEEDDVYLKQDKETCQWHLYVMNEKCTELADNSATIKKTLEIRYFCDKHFEELADKGKLQRAKSLKDMNPDEFRIAVLRRQFISPMMNKI